MDKNIFTSLFKYKPVENLTPEENFVTESFVYLLNQSKLIEPEFLIRFLELLEVPVNAEDIEQLKIESQYIFSTKDEQKAIPDITLFFDNQYYFIEVKVSSDINEYVIEQDNKQISINQIEKYKSIKLHDKKTIKIYTLTNRIIDNENKYLPSDQKLLWNDIYVLITDYLKNKITKLNLLIEFKTFMEDLKMNVPEVSYEYKKGMESFLNLLEQIEMALKKLNIAYKRLICIDYFGFYIYKDEQHRKETKAYAYYGWIGSPWDSDLLKFQYNDANAKVTIEKSNLISDFGLNKIDKAYEKYFRFNQEHFFCLSSEDQLNKLSDWIKTNYDLLNKLSNGKIE